MSIFWWKNKPENPEDAARQAAVDEKHAMLNEGRQAAVRCVGLVEESNQTGRDTLNELERQGDQVRGIHRKLDLQDDLLDESDNYLTAISGVHGALYNKAKGYLPKGETNVERGQRKDLAYMQKREASMTAKDRRLRNQDWDAEAAASGFGSAPAKGWGESDDTGFGDARTRKIQAQPKLESIKTEDDEVKAYLRDIDRGLDVVQDGVHNMHDLAVTLGTELDRQQPDVERMGHRVDKNRARFQANNVRAQKIKNGSII